MPMVAQSTTHHSSKLDELCVVERPTNRCDGGSSPSLGTKKEKRWTI